MTRRPRIAHLSTVVGGAIAIIAGFFVVRAITQQWSSVRTSLENANVAWLVAGVVVAALGMLAIALPWKYALSLVGVEAPWGATVVWYFVGEIGKYVPGGIWPVVGRGELARRGGHPRSSAYASVILSLGALYLSAMVVVAALFPLRFLDSDNDALWVLVLLPLGLALLHHRPLGWMIGRVERLIHKDLPVVVPPWSSSLRLVVAYVPSWLLIGTATWCIARAFDPDVGWMTIAPAAVLSWVVGFVLVPVPGGVGIREAAFVALVGTSMSSGVRSAIAIAARLAFVLVDAGAAAVCAALLRRFHPSFPAEEADATSPPP